MKSKPVIKKKEAAKKKKQIPPSVNHIISKSKGAEMVNRFTDNMTDLNKIVFCHGIEFDKSLFEKLLKLRGSKVIRIYNAVNEFNEHTFVITAVDVAKNDIYFKLKTNSSKSKTILKIADLPEDTDGVGNMGNQCPAYLKDVKTL